jgi:hypothetical protein
MEDLARFESQGACWAWTSPHVESPTTRMIPTRRRRGALALGVFSCWAPSPLRGIVHYAPEALEGAQESLPHRHFRLANQFGNLCNRQAFGVPQAE